MRRRGQMEGPWRNRSSRGGVARFWAVAFVLAGVSAGSLAPGEPRSDEPDVSPVYAYIPPPPVDYGFVGPLPPGLEGWSLDLDLNTAESRAIVQRNRHAIELASRAYAVPAWLIAGVIFVETGQGLPGAWTWNEMGSRQKFIVGQPASLGVMQVRYDPAELGLESISERKAFVDLFTQDETWQILAGARRLADVLAQENRFGPSYRAQVMAHEWTQKDVRTVAHEYNSGPPHWKGTTWEEAQPLGYGEAFWKFLPEAYKALTDQPLPNPLRSACEIPASVFEPWEQSPPLLDLSD